MNLQVDLITSLYVFMLAAFIGFEVIRRVSPLLHTPLMSLTNALDAGRERSREALLLGFERLHDRFAAIFFGFGFPFASKRVERRTTWLRNGLTCRSITPST